MYFLEEVCGVFRRADRGWFTYYKLVFLIQSNSVSENSFLCQKLQRGLDLLNLLSTNVYGPVGSRPYSNVFFRQESVKNLQRGKKEKQRWHIGWVTYRLKVFISTADSESRQVTSLPLFSVSSDWTKWFRVADSKRQVWDLPYLSVGRSHHISWLYRQTLKWGLRKSVIQTGF